MPIPSPLHSRTAPLCITQEWRDWSGYLAAITYQPAHEVEYYAVRNAAGLLDVSPLYKYEVSGPDALRLVNRVMTRDIAKCRVGQVMYSPWCDEDGKVIDDGTIARLGEQHFRLTAADPNLRWFQDVGHSMDAEVRDVSTKLAALALQGPNSLPILKILFEGKQSRGLLRRDESPPRNGQLDELRYYYLMQTEFDGVPMTITRTGYTGDRGYELWIAAEKAPALWDNLMEEGKGYGIIPFGLAALDILRVEAGLLLIEVDYTSSQHARIPAQKSSPYEIGLGWAVDLNKDDFIGQRALRAEKKAGAPRTFVGLEVDWKDLDRLYGAVNLPPQVAGRASRIAVPLYVNGKHVGQATSMVFSPILKKYVALATIESGYAQMGKEIEFEVTVEYVRVRAKAKVTKSLFYEPPQKKAVG
ncbi:MAG: aminomethyltransferase family protein [Anaerolineales bacterium]